MNPILCHHRFEMEALETVDVSETTGTRRIKPKMAFDELWAWELENKGKTPPKIDTEFIDGKWVQGVWTMIGKQGRHEYEDYADANITHRKRVEKGDRVLDPNQAKSKYDALAGLVSSQSEGRRKQATANMEALLALGDAEHEERPDLAESSSESDEEAARNIEKQSTRKGMMSFFGGPASSSNTPAKPPQKGRATGGGGGGGSGPAPTSTPAPSPKGKAAPKPLGGPPNGKIWPRPPANVKAPKHDPTPSSVPTSGVQHTLPAAARNIVQLDGRVERMMLNLEEKFDETDAEFKDAMQLDFNDDEAGDSTSFKTKCKDKDKIAKACISKLKTLQMYIGRSANKAEMAEIDKKIKDRIEHLNKIVALLKQIVASKPDFAEASAAYRSCKDIPGGDLSRTFAEWHLRREAESHVHFKHFTEATKTFTEDNTEARLCDRATCL